MLDFITLVDNQIPMDTQSMLQDSENQMVKVMDSTFVVDNLLALEFLNASGKVVKLSLEILQYRSEEITSFQFYFMIDPTQEDASIK